MSARLTTASLAFAVLVAAGCEQPGPVDPSPAVDAPAFAKVEGPAAIEGEIGPGALYGLYLPENWNGDLILYAHGYVPASAPIALPGGGLEGLRDGFLGLGYGFAWSSYSENGFAVKDGVTRTRQLKGLFTSKFGRPGHTYLMGHSLGGIITLMAAETNPGLYDGALPMCGLLGGSPLEIEYIFNVRVLFDYFYPGVIPGDAVNVPEGLDFATQVAPAVIGAVAANPFPALEMAGVDQIELPYTSLNELVASLLSPLFFSVVGAQDFADRVNRSGFDNSGTEYTGSLDDDALNAGVDRFVGSPEGGNYLEHWYLPDGRLSIPVLTLHTTMDPAVPFFHEAAYAQIVADAGRSDYLVQRAVERYGHCTFTPQETLGAFLDLVSWVETGAAPAP